MLLRQFLSFTYGNLISAAISFFTTPIITLLIIPAEFGKSAIFSLVLSFLVQIALLGADQSFMRMYYEKDEKERTGLVWLCIFLSLSITILLICLILPFWSKISNILFEEPDFVSIILLAGCLLFAIIDRFTSSVVRMKKKGNTFSITRIVNSAVNVLAVIIYANYIAPSFYAIIYGLLFASISSIIISIISERSFWKSNIDFGLFNSTEIKHILHFGLPLVPAFILSILFQGMDKMALRAYSSYNEIGLYSAAAKFIFPLTIIQSGFSMFWLPFSLETYEKDHDNHLFFETTFNYVFFILLISASFILVFKNVIVYLLAPVYRIAIEIMPFLILIPFIIIISDITGIGIMVKKKTYFNLIATIIALFVNFTGNYFLVSIYGAKGAAISTGLSYIIYFSVRTFISIHLFPVNYSILKFIPSFIVLLFFLFINTFFNTPWPYNLLFPLFILIIHKNILTELITILYNEIKKKQKVLSKIQ